MSAQGTRPTFLYAGMPKAGSTWLYECLRAHPAVFVPDAKGLEFFDRNFERGVDWYLGHFEAAPKGTIAGELSHDTYSCAEAPERMRRLFPDLRIIVCLREPGAAARSILNWWQTHTRLFGDTIQEMTSHPHYTALLAYRANLQRMLDAFPAEQVRVLFFEDLRRDPAGFVRGVYEFVGADPDFSPPSVGDVVNAARLPRHALALRLAYRLGGALRSVGAGRFVERAKASTLVGDALYSSRGESAVSTEIRAAALLARRMTEADFPQLEAMIGRQLPSEWRSAPPGQ